MFMCSSALFVILSLLLIASVRCPSEGDPGSPSCVGRRGRLRVAAKEIVCNHIEGTEVNEKPLVREFEIALDENLADVVQMILVRHAKSQWNELEHGNVAHKVRTAFKMAKMETHDDSLLFDAPLSKEGVNQSLRLREFVEAKFHIFEKSLFIASNLRRAVYTAINAFCPSNDIFHVHSALQEITNKADGIAFKVPVGTKPVAFKNIVNDTCLLDVTHNFGQKSVKSLAKDRLTDFLQYVFNKYPKFKKFTVVGHSNFFMFMFNSLLPEESIPTFMKTRMRNTQVVSFNLIRYKNGEGELKYAIDPKSIDSLYDGVE